MNKCTTYLSSLHRQTASPLLRSTVGRYSTLAPTPTETDHRTTVDPSEVKLHSSLRNEWWTEAGTMRALHSMNKLRVPFVRDGILQTMPQLRTQANTPLPLKGVKLLDVGCGGGILAEPLARIGASATGLDASEELISLAKERLAKNRQTNLEYVTGNIEEFCQSHPEEFDGVVASEVIEHVNDKELFLESCLKALRPDGSLFITTLNKTNLSWLGGVIMAENVLRIVPSGTHDWHKFVSPEEICRMLDKYNCKVKLVHGMCYNVLTNQWKWTANTSINYAIQLVKRS